MMAVLACPFRWYVTADCQWGFDVRLTANTFRMWNRDESKILTLRAIAEGNTIALRCQKIQDLRTLAAAPGIADGNTIPGSTFVRFAGPSRRERWVESSPVEIDGRQAIVGVRYRNPIDNVCFFFLDGRSAGGGITIEEARAGKGQKVFDAYLMAKQYVSWGPTLGTAAFARSLAEYVSPTSLAMTSIVVALYLGSAWLVSKVGLRALARVKASGQQVVLRSGLVVLAASAFSVATIFILLGAVRPLLIPGN